MFWSLVMRMVRIVSKKKKRNRKRETETEREKKEKRKKNYELFGKPLAKILKT